MVCPSKKPCVALEKTAASISFTAQPASLSAADTASPVNCFIVLSRNFPDGVMPTPTTYTADILISRSITLEFRLALANESRQAFLVIIGMTMHIQRQALQTQR